MWVIKLGGSLIGSKELAGWLDVVARNGDGKVVLVPGGGVFADAVRDAQKRTRADDFTAHQMAVLGMEQFGLLMMGINKDLVAASSDLEIAERGWQHRGIVWLPSQMVSADEDIHANWEMTSDSLAAWLAHKLEAKHLIIVKSCDLPDRNAQTADYLHQKDMVDGCLNRYVSEKNTFKTWLLHKSDYHIFKEAFEAQKLQQHGLPVI